MRRTLSRSFREKKTFNLLKKSWSIAILSSHSHQPLPSSSSQQPFLPATFTAAILTSHFSAALLSSHSHQLFSLRRCGQGLVVSYCHIMLLWPGVGGQLLSHHVARVRGWWWTVLIMSLWSGVDCQLFSSCCCGQGLMVSYSHHVAVVRRWWSAIVTSCRCGQGLVVSYCHIMLLGSGVGGELFSSHHCGQGLVVNHSHHVAVVRGWWSAIRGWWSAILIMSLWSGVGGQLLSHHVAVVRGWCHVGGQLRTRSLEEPFRGAFGKKRRFLFIKEVLIHSQS